jgi:uncharacterized protein (TIGR00725 family)
LDHARRPLIAVIGPSDASRGELKLAAQVGSLIARSDWVLVTGGRSGVMEAASRGAAEAGGLVIGVLPGESADQANPYVHVPVVTGLSEARNAVIALTAAAVIAVGKGYGTLAEIGFALKLRRPIASLGSWQVDRHIFRAKTPEQAVRFIKNRIEG